MRELWEWLKYTLSLKCPECEAPIKSTMLDMQFDSLVYECTNCKKEWI